MLKLAMYHFTEQVNFKISSKLIQTSNGLKYRLIVYAKNGDGSRTMVSPSTGYQLFWSLLTKGCFT